MSCRAYRRLSHPLLPKEKLLAKKLKSLAGNIFGKAVFTKRRTRSKVHMYHRILAGVPELNPELKSAIGRFYL